MGKFKLPDLNKRLDSQETMCVTPGGGGTSSNFWYPGTAHEKKMDPIGSKL